MDSQSSSSDFHMSKGSFFDKGFSTNSVDPYHIGHYGHALAAHQISLIKRTLGIDDKASTVELVRRTPEIIRLLNLIKDWGIDELQDIKELYHNSSNDKACTVGLDRGTQEHLLNSVYDVGKALDESLSSLASSEWGNKKRLQSYGLDMPGERDELAGQAKSPRITHIGHALATHQSCVCFQSLLERMKGFMIAADITGFSIDRALGMDDKVFTVGLDRRIPEVIQLLNFESDVAKCIVAICGVLGIGKSILARAVHHYYSKQFPYHCFVDKAGEYLMSLGLESLLSILAGDDNINVKENKFFLTLEDIECPKSLEAAIQLTNSLGCGSKVVITAKDHHLLETHGIDRIYNVERFNNLEAYELLGQIVYQSVNIPSSCVDIIYQAAKVSSGIPGLLEIIGSHLAGKQKKECEHILAEYKKIHSEETEEILLMKRIVQVSFNALKKCVQESNLTGVHSGKQESQPASVNGFVI